MIYWRKIAVMLLACVLLLAPTQTFAFSDVAPQNSHHVNILKLSDQHIINGYSDGRFRPNAKVTNRQAALMLARALQLPVTNVKAPKFKDVSKNDSAYAEIAAATAAGLFPDGDKFNPNSFISRASMARALQRAFNVQRGSQTYAIKDVPSSHWAYQYIMPLVTTGISTGYADKTFKPAEGVTRAQFASFLNRTLTYTSTDKNIVKTLTAYQRHEIEDRVGDLQSPFIPEYNVVSDMGLSLALHNLVSSTILPTWESFEEYEIGYFIGFDFYDSFVHNQVQQYLGVDAKKYDLSVSNLVNKLGNTGHSIVKAHFQNFYYTIVAPDNYLLQGTGLKYHVPYSKMLELYEIEKDVYYAVIGAYWLYTFNFDDQKIPHRDTAFSAFPKHMFNELQLDGLRYLVIDTSKGFAFDKLRIPYMSTTPLTTHAARQQFMQQYRAKQ